MDMVDRHSEASQRRQPVHFAYLRWHTAAIEHTMAAECTMVTKRTLAAEILVSRMQNFPEPVASFHYPSIL